MSASARIVAAAYGAVWLAKLTICRWLLRPQDGWLVVGIRYSLNANLP